MPQVDLETLVCGGDRKIACETLISGDSSSAEKPDLPENPPDYPADSFYVAKEDEFDWFDRNAFFERKESTKGNSNSHSTPNLSSVSNSQRYSSNFKSKASLIGFPKPHNTSYADCKSRRHCRPSNARFFPKRSRSAGKSSLPLTEPSSPKVSCIGRVRSKRQRSHRQRPLQQQPTDETDSTVVRSEKHGFWTSFKAVLRLRRRKPRNGTGDYDEDRAGETPARISVKSEKCGGVSASEPDSEPPGLGGLKRFSSGRRSDTWSEDGELVAEAEKFDSVSRGTVWRRRGVDAIGEVECGRHWVAVGPASV